MLSDTDTAATDTDPVEAAPNAAADSDPIDE
jgi:hypothetical protein